jgi:hypothetical protein
MSQALTEPPVRNASLLTLSVLRDVEVEKPTEATDRCRRVSHDLSMGRRR